MSRKSRASAADSLPRPNLTAPAALVLFLALVGTALVAFGTAFLRDHPVHWVSRVEAMINQRGPIQYVEIAMALLLLGIIVGKAVILGRQRSDLRRAPLAGLDLRNDAALQAARQKLAQDPRCNRSLVMTRVDRSLGLWLGSKDIERMAGWLAAESSRDLAASESSYSLPRYLIWAIPILGFVGTVQGLASAVTGFTVLGGAIDLLAIKNAIAKVTMGLGVAFDTTLLALVLTIPLMLLLTWVQRNEDHLLAAIDHYLDDAFLAKLPSSERQPIVIENLEDAMEAAFRRYIPDPDRYDEVFTRAIDRAGAGIESRFSNLARDYEATLRDLTAQLGTHLHSMTEVTARAVGGMVDQVRTVSHDETERFRSMLVEVHRRADETLVQHQKTAERLQVQSAASASELANRMADVAKLAAGVQDLLKVDEAVRSALQRATATGDLERTLDTLRRQSEALSETARAMARPRVLTFEEGPSARG